MLSKEQNLHLPQDLTTGTDCCVCVAACDLWVSDWMFTTKEAPPIEHKAKAENIYHLNMFAPVEIKDRLMTHQFSCSETKFVLRYQTDQFIWNISNTRLISPENPMIASWKCENSHPALLSEQTCTEWSFSISGCCPILFCRRFGNSNPVCFGSPSVRRISWPASLNTHCWNLKFSSLASHFMRPGNLQKHTSSSWSSKVSVFSELVRWCLTTSRCDKIQRSEEDESLENDKTLSAACSTLTFHLRSCFWCQLSHGGWEKTTDFCHENCAWTQKETEQIVWSRSSAISFARPWHMFHFWPCSVNLRQSAWQLTLSRVWESFHKMSPSGSEDLLVMTSPFAADARGRWGTEIYQSNQPHCECTAPCRIPLCSDSNQNQKQNAMAVTTFHASAHSAKTAVC